MTNDALKPGAWPSPVAAALIAKGGLRLAQPSICAGKILWLEGRAAEKGRTVLVGLERADHPRDLTPAPFNVRSGAQEYGGGVYCSDGTATWFVNYEDNRIYELRGDGTARPINQESRRRFADLCHDPKRERLIAVSEDHSHDGEAVTTVVAIALADGKLTTLAQGADFYSSPRIDAAGGRLAWLAWNHPDMPWDASTLYVCDDLDRNGSLSGVAVAGGTGKSIFQPDWGADGCLYFMSDCSNWWNLQRWNGTGIDKLMDEQADCGFGQWLFGMSTWGFIDDHRILCCGARAGTWSLAIVDILGRNTRWLDLPFNTIEHVATARGRAVLIAASATQVLSVIDLDVDALTWRTLRESNHFDIDSTWISTARALSFPSGNNDQAHAFYYPPQHAEIIADDVAPPLLVKCHGGPTAHADAGLDWRIQFWTSRGFAVLDVNYRGSTGFGRQYREKLYGEWGVADVEDAVNAARYLVDQGLADPARLAISGGSAGGFTVLCALTFGRVFKAGASLYGVSDLESLLKDTHKFEARYLDKLVGPWPESRALFRRRSPLHNTGQLSCPIIFMQGLRDRVVTPDQSERMAAALRDKGLPVLYISFADEGHGFRDARNIATALEAELYFYSRIFGFTAPGISFSRTIENMDT